MGTTPSYISIPATSMMIRLSANWPSRYRPSVHDSTDTVRPVAGMPMNGARCVLAMRIPVSLLPHPPPAAPAVTGRPARPGSQTVAM